MRDAGNPGKRASRNLRPTERPGRPETEGSPLDQTWKGVCGTELVPQLAGPAVRKLKVSYVRARAGRGAPGPGAPSRCAPPARRLLQALCWARQEQAGPTSRGWVGTLGCPTPQRPARGNLTRDPRPRQARDRVGPPAARVQIRTRAPEAPLLSPVPLPAS